VPPKFLLWQQGLVVRRQLQPGDVLCRQGDAGNTAFLIKRGKLEVVAAPKTATNKSWGANPLKFPRSKAPMRFELTPADVIVGEMACLSGSPRAADVTALEATEVWEVRRNVLDRLMRLPSLRLRFEKEYRQRALDLALQDTELFKNMDSDEYGRVVDFLRERLTFVRASAGPDAFPPGRSG
jgi:CRP-like cAMP-binding protein